MKYKVRVCPNCGSTNIDYANLETEAGRGFLGIGIPERYYCKDCGYVGSVILEVDRRKLKNMKFKKINYKKQKIKRKHRIRRTELMKPVFAITALFFIITSVFFLVPEIKTGNTSTKWITVNYNATGGQTIPEKKYTAGDIEKIREVSTATGIQQTTGFLVPLFFMFFTIAIVVLGISAHWERIRLFQ